MRVIVCGGRDYNDLCKVYETLDALHEKEPINALISGGARGVDTLAAIWARGKKIKEIYIVEPEWEKYGRAAGSIRNGEMLALGNVDMVIAFPGGRGTADMIRRARAAGIKVRMVQ